MEETVFLAQRIYALSAQPGEIEREFVIDLPGDRDYRIKRQSQFQSYVAEIMDLLRGRASEELAALV